MSKIRLLPLVVLWVLVGAGWLQAEPDLIPLGPFGGDVRSLTGHPENPDRVFLGTADGQIYVSDNWGGTWKKLSPGIQRRELVVDSVVINPENPAEMWVGGWELKSDQGGLYHSEDSGQTFQHVDLGMFESSIRAVALAPTDPRIIAVGITEGVLLSRDGGRNWERITRGYRSLYNVHSLAFDPRDSSTLYVGTWRLAWKTENLGEKWTPIHDGMFWDSDLFSIQVNPLDSSNLVAGACSGFYRSVNAGAKWVRLRNGIPPAAKRTRVVRFDPREPDVVYVGTTEGLFRSTNGGDSFECLLPGVVINSILIHPRNTSHILLGTDDAGVLATVDGGKTFVSSNNGFIQRQITQVTSRPGKGNEFFAAVALDSSHGGFFWSKDSGATWQSYNEGLGSQVSGIRAILPAAGTDEVFLGTTQGIFRGVPGRREWSQIPSSRALFVNGIQFSGADESSLLVAAREGLFSLDTKGDHATRMKIPVYDRGVNCVLNDATTGESYIGTEMGVFRSDDHGKSWSIKVEGLPYISVNSLSIADEKVFAATKEGLFSSKDRGDHWAKAQGIYPIEIVAVSAGPQPGQVVAADPLVGYLFASQDSGETWEPINLGLELSRISSLSRTDTGELLAGTVAEGVYRIVLPGSASPLGR